LVEINFGKIADCHPLLENCNLILMELGDKLVGLDIPSKEQFDLMNKYQALLRKK
jgi:hypothetical protein